MRSAAATSPTRRAYAGPASSPTPTCSTAWRSPRACPRPKLPVPFITPWLSALWLGLVTPVDTNVARPLVEGLTTETETVVTDPGAAAAFQISPAPFDETLRRALADEMQAGADE